MCNIVEIIIFIGNGFFDYPSRSSLIILNPHELAEWGGDNGPLPRTKP
jgi:hypothetical protein